MRKGWIILLFVPLIGFSQQSAIRFGLGLDFTRFHLERAGEEFSLEPSNNLVPSIHFTRFWKNGLQAELGLAFHPFSFAVADSSNQGYALVDNKLNYLNMSINVLYNFRDFPVFIGAGYGYGLGLSKSLEANLVKESELLDVSFLTFKAGYIHHLKDNFLGFDFTFSIPMSTFMHIEDEEGLISLEQVPFYGVEIFYGFGIK